MGGPEHYREAEKDIGRSERAEEPAVALLLARAQVHATLALVAAMAAAHDPHGLDVPDWAAVLGTGG